MNRFNLTFKGEIHTGRDPERTRVRLGDLLGIEDALEVEKYFSGETVVLRGNLDRKTAAEYFYKLKKIGLEVELVKMTAAQNGAANGEPEKPPQAKPAQRKPAREKPTRQTGAAPVEPAQTPETKAKATPDPRSGQSWAVSAKTRTAIKPPEGPSSGPGAASKTDSQTLEREAAEQAAIVEAELAAEKEREARRKATEAAAAHKLAEEKKAARLKALREQLERETAEEKRREEEEAARLKALKEEQERKAAEEKRRKEEEAARLKALREEQERKAAEEQRRQEEEAARLKTLKAEQKREAAEKKRKKKQEAERLKALREEEARQAAEEERKKEEEATRLKAEREEQERKAAEKKRKQEEAARLKAEREEQERKAAEEKRKQEEEEAARLKALKEEQERKAAEEKRRKEEEAARLKALKEEQERKAAEEKRRKEEEAARLKALKEEQERKAAEEKRRKEKEAARLKAAEEQRKREEERRRRAEEAARLQAIREEEERKASEEAAKRKAAEEAARQDAERAATKRREAEEAERRAHQEAADLRAAEDAARREVELAQQKRRAAEEEERRAHEQAAKRKAAEEQAKRKAELAEEKARQAERARIEAVRAEHDAQRVAMEEAAVQRAARELGKQPSLKPAEARVKTRLEVPRGKSIATDAGDQKPVVSSRQPGVPNVYSLRPFRNTPEIKARSAHSAKVARRAFTTATLALAALLIAGASYLGLPRDETVNGARAIAIAPQSGPLLLAGDRLLLHDRAGVGAQSIARQDLGLAELPGPITFDQEGQLLAAGRLENQDPASVAADAVQLLRCNLQTPGCAVLSAGTELQSISALVEHPLSASVFIADREAGQIVQLAEDGTLLGRADAPVPDHPVLRLASGLLFMNSKDGPAISVLRYDEGALGQQLDEILLLPPPAIEAGQTRVWDFVSNGQQWLATMFNPDTNEAGVYRFDDQWNYLGQLDLAKGYWPEELVSWGSKILVRDSRQLSLPRFNAQGVSEAALTSDLLQELVDSRQRSSRLRSLGWRSGLILIGLLMLGGCCLGYLHHNRKLVYRPHRERGADPIDGLATDVAWVAPVPDRAARIRLREAVYGALAVTALALAIALGVSVVELTALLLALSGPVIAFVLFSRSPIGHIGVLPGLLLLADHAGTYHLGGDARLQYRGPFLLVDDVVVFTGSWLFPAFSPEQVSAQVDQLAKAGVRVDRKTVWVKLLQGRHPLATGAIAIAAGLLLATSLLVLTH